MMVLGEEDDIGYTADVTVMQVAIEQLPAGARG